MEWRRDLIQKIINTDSRFIVNSREVKYCGCYYSRIPSQIPDIIVNAINRYRQQKQRCTDKNSKSYKWYKNVNIIWNKTEFVDWFISQLLTRDNWICPVVSRRNDIGDYSSTNCELIEQSENLSRIKITEKMLIARSKTGYKNGKPVILVNIDNAEDVLEFESAYHASRELNKAPETVRIAIKKGHNVKFNGRRYNASWK